MTLNLAALNAGNNPASTPTRTLNAKAKAIAPNVMTGWLSVGVACEMIQTANC